MARLTFQPFVHPFQCLAEVVPEPILVDYTSANPFPSSFEYTVMWQVLQKVPSVLPCPEGPMLSGGCENAVQHGYVHELPLAGLSRAAGQPDA